VEIWKGGGLCGGNKAAAELEERLAEDPGAAELAGATVDRGHL